MVDVLAHRPRHKGRHHNEQRHGGVTMSKHNKSAARSTMARRDVLRALAAGAGVAATSAAPLASPAAAAESEQEKRKARYKETDHVKAYYRVNRYPG
jgi:hypothetical protein